jgi:DNA-binding response OmpR family regulator
MNEKILIVDADKESCSALTEMLVSERYQVLAVHTGKEGLECIQKQFYDVTLVDTTLPDKSGVDIVRTIKEINRNIIVIMISAYPTIESAKSAIKAGAFDYLTKPVESLKLSATIKEALGERKLRLGIKAYLEKPEILVVEDDELVRESIVQYLQYHGYSVDSAESGEEGLQKIVSHTYHALIVDLRLPKMNGIEFIKKATDLVSREFLSVIITAYPTIETTVESLKKGVYEYIEKPVKPDALLKVLSDGWMKRKLDVLVYNLLKPGHSYLIKEAKPMKSFMYFSNLLAYGFPGLCITRLHPDFVASTYGLIKTDIYWLTAIAEQKYRAIQIADLKKLTDTILKFITDKKEEHAVVLLDGIESIIATNGFENTVESLQKIWDAIAKMHAWLFLPVNADTLAKKEVAFLERNMESIFRSVKF